MTAVRRTLREISKRRALRSFVARSGARRALLPAVGAALGIGLALAATSMRADEEAAGTGVDARPEGGAAAAGSSGLNGAAEAARYREARAEFMTALSAGAYFGADSSSLRDYPLYPYLEAARIERALAAASGADGAADSLAQRFLNEHEDTPVARTVRQAWLRSLARREQWTQFLAIGGSSAGDRASNCQRLRARIALDDIEGLAPLIVDTWLSGDQLPLECEPVFEWLRNEGPLTNELIEQRVVLLLGNGQAAFARVIASRLPPQRAAPLLRWADMIEHPRRSVDALIASPAMVIARHAIESGWQRLTRNEPAIALERYVPLMQALDLDRREASPYALALALGLAWDRRREALDLFAAVDPRDLSDYALGWLARAALWNGEFDLASDAITAMSAAQRDEARWRYWAARTAEEQRDRSRARELYASVLANDNYYSAMAAARLGDPAQPHPRSLDVDERSVEDIASLPAFVRARELWYARLPSHATAEWRHGTESLDDAARSQTVHVAARWGWYNLAVATATRHRVFNDYSLLYPRPYDDAVEAASELTKLEAPLIYGMIRQESLYRADAASGAGAIGLAQLLPDTARRAARRWDLPAPSYADLFIPEVNVKLGAAELRRLIDEFGGQIAVGLAGYNAGPKAARRWLPEKPLDSDIWIENIPFNETRDYVQRVLWHSLVFAWLDSGEPRTTKAWLAKIEPVGGADAEQVAAARIRGMR